jgi:hypothetical protein
MHASVRGSSRARSSRLQARLTGVERVDLEVLWAEDKAPVTFEDIPFCAAAGEVLVFPTAAALRVAPAHVARMRLVAVGQDGRKELGQYTFVHTPS